MTPEVLGMALVAMAEGTGAAFGCGPSLASCGMLGTKLSIVCC